MALLQESQVVDFDADAALDAIDATDGTDVHAVVEYDVHDYRVLYLSDFALDMYEDEAQAFDHFDQIHSHVHLDFTEIDLFTDALFPVADGVKYVTTALDFLKLVRVYHDDTGLFLSLSSTTDEVPIVDTIREYMTA